MRSVSRACDLKSYSFSLPFSLPSYSYFDAKVLGTEIGDLEETDNIADLGVGVQILSPLKFIC